MRILIVTAALLLSAGTAAAENSLELHPGMTGVIDIGDTDCAIFSEMHYNGPRGMRHHVLTWVQGYVYAKTGSNIQALLDKQPEEANWNFDTLSDVFVNYCADNPEAKVAEAAITLYSTLTE